MTQKHAWLGCLVAASLAANASAVVTYVDATDGSSGNTAVAPSAGGGVFNPVAPFGTQGPASDGLWDARAFANNATIYQNVSAGANVDDAQRLVTSVSGLPAAPAYNVYAYFWSDTSNTWRLRAGLTDAAGDLPLYLPGGSGVTQFYTGSDATVFSNTLAPNPFDSSVMIAEGNRRLYQVFLGQVTGTSVSVYIDDGPASTQTERTWYDGIGYERIPEPASIAVAGVAALGLIAATRRRRG